MWPVWSCGSWGRAEHDETIFIQVPIYRVGGSMRKAVVILIALLAIVNIPMLGSDVGKATPTDVTGLSTQFYDDFETNLASWTVNGQVWTSTNVSTHGSQSAYLYNGGINRAFTPGHNTNITVSVDFQDLNPNDNYYAGLHVYNATTAVAIGTFTLGATSSVYTVQDKWADYGHFFTVGLKRTAGWHTYQIYLHDGVAGLLVDATMMATLNITNPVGYGFNSTKEPLSGGSAKHVYIDQFLVYEMWQSDVYTPVTTSPFPAHTGAWDRRMVAGVFYNVTTANYHMYYTASPGAAGTFFLVNSSDGITWDWGSMMPLESDLTRYTGSVVVNAGHWYRFYDNTGGLCYMANSSDGLTFTDDRQILAPGGGDWDAWGIQFPFAWISGGTWYIMYNEFGATGDTGLATSPDGFTWTKSLANPLFTWGTKGIYSYSRPFAEKIGSTTYLILGDAGAVGGANCRSLRAYQSTDTVNWTNATIKAITVPDEWRVDRYSDGSPYQAVALQDPYFFDGPDGHFMIYGAGSAWLLEAQSPHSFPQIVSGQVWQYGYAPFENCANNVTSSGHYWHYGANEFTGTVDLGMRITPSIGPVNVTVTSYTPGAFNDSENGITFTANQTPAGAVSFLIQLNPLTTYAVIRDGVVFTRFTTNATGWHTYTYAGTWSAHTFAFRVTFAGTSGIDWTFPGVADSATLCEVNLTTYPPGPGSPITIMPTTGIGSWQESQVGQMIWPLAGYHLYRTYLSFNTTPLPDSATILSAELRLMLREEKYDLSPDFNILMYGSNFTTMGIDDWNKFTDYQGVLLSASAGVANTWYSMPISTDQINLTGMTQFMMRSSREGIAPLPTAWDETLRFWNISSAYRPVLVVKVQILGTILALETDSGTWYNSSIFPEVQDWNLTYDLLYFSFSTIPAMRNATIFKQASAWTIEGMAPACNYTDNSTETRFEDLFDSITYRVWFTAPKAYAYTLCHIALYNSFTGEGLFWEQLRVIISDGDTYDPSTAQTVSNPDIFLNSKQNFTLTVADYFGNLVTNYSIYTSAASMDIYLPVPIYSYKFYNQNPTFALLRVHYNLTGAPYSEFIPPYDSVNRYLKAGTYRFNITFYNATGYAGNTYTWVRTIPSSTFPGAGFVILEGDTISEAIAAANGVKAVVLVIADLVTPDIIWVGFNMPQVPAYLMTVPDSVVFNNRYLVDADITQTRTGWFLNFSTPIPGNVTVSTLISDDFRFVGNLSTQIYVNTTAATVYSNANLPAGISLAGGTYTIWTNRTISAVRDTHFRWQRTFTYQYFPATDLYQTELTFQNDVGIQWRNLTMFIPFQNNSNVNNASVRVYDMNNTVYLGEGVNYVLSDTGIHMWFANWNASLWRGFRVTYTTVNETEYQIPATVLVNQLGDGTTVTMAWGGDSFYYGIATWTNAFREIYDGPLYITLDLTVSIDPNTVVVLGESGLVVTTAVVYGNTIVIPSIHLDVGSKVVFTILFQSTSAASPMDLTFAGIPVMFVAIAIMISAFVIGVTLFMFQKEERIKQFGRLLIGITVLAMGFISIVIIYFIVTT